MLKQNFEYFVIIFNILKFFGYNFFMKELDFINILKNSLDDSSLLGDDCAYLKDLGIFITQDTLVEDVHFTMYTTSAYNLGRKAVSVNLSDLAAALSKPVYISVSLSVPNTIKDSFVSELYRGINDVCKEYNIKVTGGDITGSEKIVISVCAIGKKISKYISSRSNARKGDYILATGSFGASSAGLYALQNFLYADDFLINSQINPRPRIKEGLILADAINSDIAVMDTSDGLIDALYKIALASRHSIEIDINKVNVDNKLVNFSDVNKLDYKNFVKWGGEDFELIVAVPENIYLNLDENIFRPIGRVLNKDISPCVIVKDNDKTEKITKDIFEKYTYNHFKDKL